MHVNVKLDLVAEAALPLARDGAAGAAKAWALTDLANALLGTGIDWSPRENAGLMLLAGAEEAAKEAVETWLRLYEDDQRALREYMQEAKRAAPRVLDRCPSAAQAQAKRGGGDCLTEAGALPECQPPGARAAPIHGGLLTRSGAERLTPDPKFIEGSDKAVNTVPPNDFSYFEMINDLAQKEPVGALDPEIMGSLAAVGIVKGKPFKPD